MGKNKSASNLINVIDFNNDRIAFISGSTTLMSISSSGAVTVTGVISGSNAQSASYALNAGLLNNKDSAEFTSTGSFNAYTSSNDATVTSVAGTAVSAVAGVNALAARTSSYTTTSSFNSYTASNNTTMSCVSSTATSAIVGVGALAAQTGSYATTGSNTFVGGQYLSSSFNPTGFSTTASLYTDGGLRVSRDAYISGTLYLNNLTVFGTQSVAYISSSQLNIGTNLITVNTDTPSVRFGGLAVYDSGSTGLTGSILWDSQNNHWVYSNPSGSSYSGGMFISGPRTSTLGSETGTTSCMLLAGQGGDHLTSSAIYHDTNITCIGNSKITGNLNVVGNSCLGGGSFYASTDSTFVTDKSYTFRDAVGITNPNGLSYCSAATTVISVGSMSNGNSIITTGNVGIGIACPTVPLQALGTIATGTNISGWGRFSFDTDVVKIQASKDGIDPIGISFFTQASGGAFAERMRIACDGRIGIGTALPSAELQVNKNCDVVVAISNCVSVTTGNRGALAFYNCATSTVALIRAGAVTDNVGTELQFHTRPAGGSLTQVLTLGNTGVASFTCQICTTSAALSGNIILNRANTSAGNNIEWRTANTLNWYVGTRGLVDNNFYIVNEGLSANNLILNASTGAATFACQVSTPTIIANNSSGFAACITSCSTDYSMYVRNMSSGFPLSIYTVGDSNGVNDDLKAIKIARSSNDNQFLALSLIYGGYGYGYKLAPRYYNGSAYVCGNPTVIDSYGNVGINNTSPTMPLSIGGCANADRLAVNWSCFNTFGEHLQIRGCARLFFGQFRVSYGPGDGNYVFLTHDDVNGYLCICRTVYSGNMIISPFGGVGINTSVVSSKLSVNSGINTSTATVMTLQQATNGAVKDAAGFGLAIQNGGESTNAADLIISTATGGALCERMRITNSGYVGIGTSSPNISGGLSGNAILTMKATTNSRVAILELNGCRDSDGDNNSYIMAFNNSCTSPFGVIRFNRGTVDGCGSITLSTSGTDRMIINSSGLTCFTSPVWSPAAQQPSGFTVYSFPVNYGASYTDISSGNYLSIGGTEPGTVNTYCAYAHGGISPRAVAANTEGMSWTCLRFVLRVVSPVGDVSTTPTYLQTAGYFYATGWYGICTCTNIGGVMDGSRGYSTVVLPWVPFSSFQNAGDVTGFGIKNVGPTTTRIGSVYIQYK